MTPPRHQQPLGKHMVAVPVTEGWVVLTKRRDVTLGVIEWYAQWKQWQFVPAHDTGYTWDCLQALSLFLAGLNAAGGPT